MKICSYCFITSENKTRKCACGGLMKKVHNVSFGGKGSDFIVFHLKKYRLPHEARNLKEEVEIEKQMKKADSLFE